MNDKTPTKNIYSPYYSHSLSQREFLTKVLTSNVFVGIHCFETYNMQGVTIYDRYKREVKLNKITQIKITSDQSTLVVANLKGEVFTLYEHNFFPKPTSHLIP